MDVRREISTASLDCLSFLPKIVGDDAQIRHLDYNPFLGRVGARYPLPGDWVAHHTHPVVYEAPDVGLVPKDAVTSLAVAASTSTSPRMKGWT